MIWLDLDCSIIPHLLNHTYNLISLRESLLVSLDQLNVSPYSDGQDTWELGGTLRLHIFCCFDYIFSHELVYIFFVPYTSSLLLALHNLSYISICVATESNGLGDVNCDHMDCDDITEHGPSHEEVSCGMYT